jgi:DNA helicase IV
LARGAIPAPKNRRAEVFVLGRYRRDEEFVPQGWRQRFGDRLAVTFATVHASKGLEADYVIVPRLTKGIFGFPSEIEDDPVLQLAMPQSETFPQAEERRLFYVALTRARRSAVLITVERHVSDFISELIKEHGLQVNDLDGQQVTPIICPKCKQGIMVPRTRMRDGARFWGCNRFPRCRSTANAIVNAKGRVLTP